MDDQKLAQSGQFLEAQQACPRLRLVDEVRLVESLLASGGVIGRQIP